MRHQHLSDGSNGVHTYRRKYLGNGRYYQRGVVNPPMEVGDTFICNTEPNRELSVDRVMSLKDSKGKHMTEEQKTNALYEAELVDPIFDPNFEYKPLVGF